MSDRCTSSAASSYDPLDARLGRTSSEPVETTKGKPVRYPARKKSDAAYVYANCDVHEGEIEYPDSGCAKCREESEARSAANFDDRAEPAQATPVGGVAKEVPHDGRASATPPTSAAQGRHAQPDPGIGSDEDLVRTIQSNRRPAPNKWLCDLTHPGEPCPATNTEFDTFPVLQEALWLLLGGGLDDVGKQKWLAWRLERNYSTPAIFHDAIVQIDGMVAT